MIKPLRVGIVGGSVAGLATAQFLRARGAEVTVFERSSGVLAERGAGIALDPTVLEPIGGVNGHPISGRIVIGANGKELWRTPIHKYMTAWSAVYKQLRSRVPNEIVQPGVHVSQVESQGDKAVIHFHGGGEQTFDFVVGADGLGSMTRQFVSPDFEPVYCGYVAIRGMLPEQALPSASAALAGWADTPGFVNCFVQHSHVTAYWIPRGDGKPGRILNWMWYRNCPTDELKDFLTDRAGRGHRWSLPPGEMGSEQQERLKSEMVEVLPGPFAAAANATETLFEQAIYRGVPDSIVRGRVALVGDAAHIAVPHIGAGVSLGIQDALALAEALCDEPAALVAWGKDRHARTKADLDVAARIGISLQHEDHDYLNWSPADFDAWWQKMVAGHHLYFED